MGTKEEQYQVLKRCFGYSAFREGQETAIDSILRGQDVLGVMPTGAGKSLCYQLPALMMRGVTLVISPLISLMKDQVNALTQSGIPAAYINSSLTPRQYRETLNQALAGGYKLIYVAPERLLNEDFESFIQMAQISMVTVDEAHCVSQWGQDFRPGYLDILPFIERFPLRPVVSAFTATATQQVREDIQKLLGLQDPSIISTGFDRKNLYFEVQKPKDKLLTLIDLVRRTQGKPCIVYCATRKTVEQVGKALCARGIAAGCYHAGMSDATRQESQEAFLYDRISVLAATNAFGMGIDKSNVSTVIHYNMPADLESYYQEAGRAGRDGEPAQCILLYGGQDVVKRQFLIEHAHENETLDEDVRAGVLEKSRERLKQMTFYCHTKDCLRAYLLRYFGEDAPHYCGNCYNCTHHFEQLDITIPAQKILSCVRRTGERFGVKTVIDVLRGSKAQKILQWNLDKQSTYGLMSDVKEGRLREIIHYLAQEEYLSITDTEYPILKTGRRAKEVLSQRLPISMKIVKEQEETEQKAPKKARPDDGGTQHPELFERLRTLRGQIAAQQGVPSYIVFTNASLSDMCARLPRTKEAFMEVSGVGSAKLSRYGDEFLHEIDMYLQDNGG